MSGVAQRIAARDSQYATSRLSRATRIAEPQDNDFTSGALTVRGPIGKLEAQATTAYVDQEFGSTYDASILASSLGVASPVAYIEDRSARLLSQEVRLSDPTARHPWIIGATILHSTSLLKGRFTSVGDDTIDARRDEGRTSRTSPCSPRVRSASQARSISSSGCGPSRRRAILSSRHLAAFAPTASVLPPSGTLSWHRDDLGLVWLRYASAVRPAGISRTADPTNLRIPGDELQSLELGWRIRAAGDRLALHGAVFGSAWQHLRSDTVGPDGLLGTVDAGNAVNYGLELGGVLNLSPITIDFGATLQRARLTSPSSNTGLDRDDRRLPVVPDISSRLTASRTLVAFGSPASVYGVARYTGRTRLSFDPLLDRPAGNYATIDAGATIDRGPWHWSIAVDNLLDSRGNSFGFGNPFTLATSTQTVPIRPRTITLRATIGL
ncbi:hypothetical protein NHF48_004400 [Sphingomonas sp. H160509]|uniref:hypothetical protein n=1 Tax=Sphingomonas sp. H160509 TaxID=2955313 RepID=UPI002097E1F8|nr:hypothetical protein [Sphingomonas sp. H160509]MDD1450404.1 hypothetical protein [Sphingomonas sp. H160509]